MTIESADKRYVSMYLRAMYLFWTFFAPCIVRNKAL